ncbi:MAG: hypothetical protein U0520_05365 [Candidatus Saccharimonadales bacterium]
MKKIFLSFRAAAVVLVLFSAFVLGTKIVVAQQQPATTGQQQTTSTPVGGGTNADNVCKGVLSAETGTFSSDTTVAACQESGDGSFGFLVRRIINIFSMVVGAVSVIMIIIGGFRYIISGGDSSGVSGAKNTILYAIVGLVIVLFAQVIIRFILTNAASVTK